MSVQSWDTHKLESDDERPMVMHTHSRIARGIKHVGMYGKWITEPPTIIARTE